MRIEGKRYSVWRARGPLWQRQIDANRAGCLCAVEQHFNAHTDRSVNYAMALIDNAGSFMSKAWGAAYAARVAREFDIPDRGVVRTTGRGSYNVRFYKCPAILVEPGFVSNPEFAAIVQTGEGIDAVARCLVDSIVTCFPEGGLVALSVGHKYRGGKDDPGAPVYQGALVDPETDSETELNDLVINVVEQMLLAIPHPGEADTDPSDLAPGSVVP